MISPDPGFVGAVWFVNVRLLPAAAPIVGVVSVGEVASTRVGPLPVTELTVFALIRKTLPAPAVSSVLFVRVSVVARPTRVSVAAGNVRVPEATAVGATVVSPEVPPASGSPPAAIDLFASVSVVARPTSVSFAEGSVSVPEAVACAWTVVVPLTDPGNVTPVFESDITVLKIGNPFIFSGPEILCNPLFVGALTIPCGYFTTPAYQRVPLDTFTVPPG